MKDIVLFNHVKYAKLCSIKLYTKASKTFSNAYVLILFDVIDFFAHQFMDEEFRVTRWTKLYNFSEVHYLE